MDALTKWSATAVAEAKPRLSLRPRHRLCRCFSCHYARFRRCHASCAPAAQYYHPQTRPRAITLSFDESGNHHQRRRHATAAIAVGKARSPGRRDAALRSAHARADRRTDRANAVASRRFGDIPLSRRISLMNDCIGNDDQDPRWPVYLWSARKSRDNSAQGRNHQAIERSIVEAWQ